MYSRVKSITIKYILLDNNTLICIEFGLLNNCTIEPIICFYQDSVLIKYNIDDVYFAGLMAKNFENGVTQMVRTTMAIPIDIGGGQVAKINLPSGATLAGPVKVMTLPNRQTIAHVTVMAPPGVVEKYVAQAAADSEASGGGDVLPKTIPPAANNSTPTTTPAPTPTPASKPAAPPPASAPSAPTPTTPSSSTPANLFDKLSSKPAPPEPEKPEPRPRGRPKIRSSSSESDNVPLSRLSSQKQDSKTVAPKRKPPVKEKPYDAKPQTGFGSFLAEKRQILLQNNPKLTEKDITREAKLLWGKLDVKSKNNYIRNSEAYKLKKGVPLVDEGKTEKKLPKIPKQGSDTSTTDKNTSAQPKSGNTLSNAGATSIPKSEKKEETSSSGYHLPKRNVKRKFFDVEEDYDKNDADWEMPEHINRKSSKSLDSGIVPSSMPPLKFKKKSKQTADSQNLPMPTLNKVDKMAVNDDIDLPSVLDLDEKPKIPTPLTDSKTQALKFESKDVIKESTPPPPLRKIESVAPSERKANLKLICLHDGCFEEATTEPQRGKYWCSDKCCIKYTKVIFNAWVGARRANMIG